MLVCVQYEVDGTTEVVQPSSIRDFRPTSVADFDCSTLYDVWWTGDDCISGGYYKAKLLHLTGKPLHKLYSIGTYSDIGLPKELNKRKH